MSDENEEQPQMGFIQFGPSPEQIEQARLSRIASGHETLSFLKKVAKDRDDFRILQGILHHAEATEGGAATYYQGLLSGLATNDIDNPICIVCGEDHDKALHEMADAMDVDKARHPSSNDRAGEDRDATFQGDPVEDGIRLCCATHEGTPHEYRCPRMLEFNLEPDDDGSERVMCRRCQTWYESLEDRMLKPPGVTGCEGCKIKTKWG